MNSWKKTLLTSVCLTSSVITCLTLLHFTKFLSVFTPVTSDSTQKINNGVEDGDKTVVSYTARAIIVDISLLCIFMIQHSSLIPLQDMISSSIQLPVLSRSLLNLFTSITLQILMRLWMPIHEFDLWMINTHFAVPFHTICWVIIYVMLITMDITDFLGLKQVYNYLTGRPSPASLKSDSLKHLQENHRHPSFLCLAFIFWFHPHMRLDRLLLAIVWTVYMVMVWRPDMSDYKYIVQQQTTKLAMM